VEDVNAPVTLDEITTVIEKTKRTIERMALDGGWKFTEEAGKGRYKRRLYALKDLPKDIRAKVSHFRLNASLKMGEVQALVPAETENSVVVASEVPVVVTDERQRRIDGSRQLILQYVRTFNGSVEKAVQALNAGFAEGGLNADLMHAMRHCNDKVNQERVGKLSMRTVNRWKTGAKKGNCIPKKTRHKTDWQTVWWLPLFLACYRKPQKPTLTDAHNAFALAWQEQGFKEACPSYDAVYRLKKTIPLITLETGRATGSELAALKSFVRRDWSGMSNEVWVGDGHTFKAKVRHPEHGYAFAPEVTVIIDAASRFIVGWAFSLSENQIAVSAALGSSMVKHGKPLIYYSDNGPGQVAKTIDCPAGGMLARLGVHHETGIPGNPQGRGIIEGFWDITTIWTARQMPTFQGTGMDDGTLRKAKALIDSAKKKGTVPEFVPSWSAFIEACEARFEWYNTQHQHSSLGGKTPAEVYHANFDERWGCPLTADENANLYRPFVERVPVRGEVRFINNVYFHQSLEELPANTKVRVAFDLTDAQQVWVSDLQGRFICEAVFEGNKRAGFAVPLKDRLKDQRIDGIIKLAEEKIALANAERGFEVEGQVLQRVELQGAEVVEPLKRVVLDGDFVKQPPADKQLSWLETQQFLQEDKAVNE
jgi:putative transposase